MENWQQNRKFSKIAKQIFENCKNLPKNCEKFAILKKKFDFFKVKKSGKFPDSDLRKTPIPISLKSVAPCQL